MSYSPDVQTSAVITTVITTAIIGIILYYFFEKYRHIREIFMPRLRTNKDLTPSEPNQGFGGWIISISKINDMDTLNYIGLDAFMFLKFLYFCILISGVSAISGMVFLWPLYFTSNGHQDGVAGVGLYTMANIEPNGHRLYVSVLFCWLFSIYFLYEIENIYKIFVKLRHQFLLTDDPRLPVQEKLSVLVENLPSSIQTGDELKKLFETIFPNQIATARIASLTTELEEQIQLRENILTELEIAIAFEKSSPEHERKKIKINHNKNEPQFLCGDEVDAIEFYTQKLKSINSKIRDIYELKSPLDSNNPLRPSTGSNNGGVVLMTSKDNHEFSSSTASTASSTSPTFENIVGIPTKTGLIGTFLYAISNVIQEKLVKTYDRMEFLGMLGINGMFIGIIQFFIMEYHRFQSILWTYEIILYTIGYILCLFFMYSNTSSFLTSNDATLFNLSLLTSDVYAVIFSYFVFQYSVHWMYFVAFTLTTIGLLFYYRGGQPTSSKDIILIQQQQQQLQEQQEHDINCSSSSMEETNKLSLIDEMRGDENSYNGLMNGQEI